MTIDRVAMTMDAMVCFLIVDKCDELTESDNKILEGLATIMDNTHKRYPLVTVPEILAVLEKRYLNDNMCQ